MQVDIEAEDPRVPAHSGLYQPVQSSMELCACCVTHQLSYPLYILPGVAVL